MLLFSLSVGFSVSPFSVSHSDSSCPFLSRKNRSSVDRGSASFVGKIYSNESFRTSAKSFCSLTIPITPWMCSRSHGFPPKLGEFKTFQKCPAFPPRPSPSSRQLTHPWPSSFTADILFVFYYNFPPLARGFTKAEVSFPESWLLGSNNLLDLNISQCNFFSYLAFQFAFCMTSLKQKLSVNIPVVLNIWILHLFSSILCFSFFPNSLCTSSTF